MKYVYYNPNRKSSSAGDCAIRAVSKALNIDWDKSYALIVVSGFRLGNVPTADSVWGSVLRMRGFTKHTLPNTCPDCYTVKDFCLDHPKGTYVLGTGNHAVTVVDGDYYDLWDSGNEIPIYYWRKE